MEQEGFQKAEMTAAAAAAKESATSASSVASTASGADGTETPLVSSEELDLVASILNRLTSDKKLTFFHSKPCRGLRKALHPLVDDLRKRSFGGATKSDYETKKQLKLEAEARRNRKRAADAALINKRKLREGRLEKLKALQGAYTDSTQLPLIPDGVPDRLCGGEAGIEGAAGGARLLVGDASRPGGGAEEQEEEEKTKEGEKEGKGDGEKLHGLRSCYVCKSRFDSLHHFYDMLCPSCSDLNWRKRNQVRVCLSFCRFSLCLAAI